MHGAAGRSTNGRTMAGSTTHISHTAGLQLPGYWKSASIMAARSSSGKTVFPNAQIVGFDINPDCKRFEEDRISVVTGDQTDTKLLQSLGGFDVVIDDGSHVREHQSQSFNALWPSTRGVYVIEDCHGIFPAIVTSDRPIRYEYPWVLVLERPERIIRGTPSRELRPDEAAAREKSLAR